MCKLKDNYPFAHAIDSTARSKTVIIGIIFFSRPFINRRLNLADRWEITVIIAYRHMKRALLACLQLQLISKPHLKLSHCQIMIVGYLLVHVFFTKLAWAHHQKEVKDCLYFKVVFNILKIFGKFRIVFFLKGTLNFMATEIFLFLR